MKQKVFFVKEFEIRELCLRIVKTIEKHFETIKNFESFVIEKE
jgi:inhibitor of KinA sporulation pathway (predicted exonuclease)